MDPELGLRDVPRKSAQWGWQTEWFRRLILLAAILNPPCDEVVRIPLPPCLLLLPTPRRLAFRFLTSSLTGSDSLIWTEPAAANTAGFLSCVRHRDSSSPHHQIKESVRSVCGVGHSGEQRWGTSGECRSGCFEHPVRSANIRPEDSEIRPETQTS